MPRTILLTSKGLPPDLEQPAALGPNFSRLFPSPRGLHLAFVTTGVDVMPRQEYARATRARLESLGFLVEDVDLKGRSKSSLETTLEQKDVLYVVGGQTFYLLDHMRKSGFGELIGPLVDEDLVYIGPSAGAYVACPSVEMAGWKHPDINRYGVEDLTGLNLVPFLISAHFEDKFRGEVEAGGDRTSLPVVAITDAQGILVQGDHYELLNPGGHEFFNGAEKFFKG